MVHSDVRGPMVSRPVQGGFFDCKQLGGWLVGVDDQLGIPLTGSTCGHSTIVVHPLGVPLSGNVCGHGTKIVVHLWDVNGQHSQPTCHNDCIDGREIQLVQALGCKEERGQGHLAASSLARFEIIFILKK